MKGIIRDLLTGAVIGLLLNRQEVVNELRVRAFRLQLRNDIFAGVVQGLMEEMDQKDTQPPLI